MTITELILELAGIWREHGDLTLMTNDMRGYHSDVIELDVSNWHAGENRSWIEGVEQ